MHGGYGSSYEQDLLIDVERGVVVGERLVVNGVDESDATSGYTVATSTSIGKDTNSQYGPFHCMGMHWPGDE